MLLFDHTGEGGSQQSSGSPSSNPNQGSRSSSKAKETSFLKRDKTIFPAGIFSQGFEFNGFRHFLKTVQNKDRALLSGIILEIS